MSDKHKSACEKVLHLNRLMRRAMFAKDPEPIMDKSQGQGRVIAILKIKPEISTRDLAFLMEIRQQSLNELLLRLERDGYVERVPSEDDRRVMMVRLTDKGGKLDQNPFDAEDIFGCLSEEELESLDTILGKVVGSMEEKAAEEGWEGGREFIERMRASMSEEDFRRLMRMRGGPGHGRGPRRGPPMGGPWDGPEAAMRPEGMPCKGPGMDPRPPMGRHCRRPEYPLPPMEMPRGPRWAEPGMGPGPGCRPPMHRREPRWEEPMVRPECPAPPMEMPRGRP